MKQAIPPSIFEKPYVRFWPLADIGVCTAQSAFGGAEYRARQELKRSPLATDNSAAAAFGGRVWRDHSYEASRHGLQFAGRCGTGRMRHSNLTSAPARPRWGYFFASLDESAGGVRHGTHASEGLNAFHGLCLKGCPACPLQTVQAIESSGVAPCALLGRWVS